MWMPWAGKTELCGGSDDVADESPSIRRWILRRQLICANERADLGDPDGWEVAAIVSSVAWTTN